MYISKFVYDNLNEEIYKYMVYWMIFFAEFIILFLTSRFLFKSLFLLFYRLTKSRRVAVYLLSFLFFPGVVVHELSHVLAAGILFVPVGHVDFIPHIHDSEVKLGSVEIQKTDFLRRFFVGVAPVLVGFSIIIILVYFLIHYGSLTQILPVGGQVMEPFWLRILVYLGIVYLLFVIGNTMFSSKRDMEGALELIIIAALLVIILNFAKFDIFGLINNVASVKVVANSIKTIDVLLAIPVVINIAFSLLLFFVGRRTD